MTNLAQLEWPYTEQLLAPPYIIFIAFSVIGLHVSNICVKGMLPLILPQEAQVHSQSINIDNGVYCAMDLQNL